MDVTRLTTALQIRNARAAFESHVGEEVYKEHFQVIGQGFNVMSLIGKGDYVYVKCEDGGNVVGMAYGYKESASIFYIQDIISKAGSGSGSAMCNWFANKTNVGMEGLQKLALTAANDVLQTVYQKPQYDFKLVSDKSGRMERFVLG